MTWTADLAICCKFNFFSLCDSEKKIWKQQRWKDILFTKKNTQKLLKYVNANLLLVLKAQ